MIAFAVFVPAAGATTLLHLSHLGPLTLGMKRAPALATGWLANRTTGCPLGGPPLPIDYEITGAKAPKGIHGSAEFTSGVLSSLSFTGGVRTAVGVTVGKTSTSRMVARYRAAGYQVKSQYDNVFQGTFVSVKKNGRDVIGGFGDHGTIRTIAIPRMQVCE